MDLQKTSQKQIKVLVRYGDQQDASTNKDSLVSQTSMCQNSHMVNSKVNLRKSQHYPKKSTHDSSNKVNIAQTSINLLTSIFVPMSTAFKNRILHKILAQKDLVLTKVNVGQTCPETLTGENFVQKP